MSLSVYLDYQPTAMVSYLLSYSNAPSIRYFQPRAGRRELPKKVSQLRLWEPRHGVSSILAPKKRQSCSQKRVAAFSAPFWGSWQFWEPAPALGSLFPKNGNGAALSALLGAGSLPLILFFCCFHHFWEPAPKRASYQLRAKKLPKEPKFKVGSQLWLWEPTVGVSSSSWLFFPKKWERSRSFGSLPLLPASDFLTLALAL